MSLCVSLSHFAAQQRLAQHCRSTILQLKKKCLHNSYNLHSTSVSIHYLANFSQKLRETAKIDIFIFILQMKKIGA